MMSNETNITRAIMPSFITEELEKSRDKKSFVAQVMDILVSEDASSTMWWLEDGRSFAVKTSTLEEDVLDKHFRGSKASSFTRRMSKWGFRKLPTKPLGLPKKTAVYHHPLFRKGAPELVRFMSDKKDKPSLPPAIEKLVSGSPHNTGTVAFKTPTPAIVAARKDSPPATSSTSTISSSLGKNKLSKPAPKQLDGGVDSINRVISSLPPVRQTSLIREQMAINQQLELRASSARLLAALQEEIRLREATAIARRRLGTASTLSSLGEPRPIVDALQRPTTNNAAASTNNVLLADLLRN